MADKKEFFDIDNLDLGTSKVEKEEAVPDFAAGVAKAREAARHRAAGDELVNRGNNPQARLSHSTLRAWAPPRGWDQARDGAAGISIFRRPSRRKRTRGIASSATNGRSR